MKIVILAGGSGTRLWPLSREDFPKQFLRFGDSESLLQKSLKRMSRFPLCEEIIISTNSTYAPLVDVQVSKCKNIKKCHVLVEPERKNTAGAIALSVKYLEKELKAKPDDVILVFPSDHFISPVEKFYGYLQQASEMARKDKILIFGIKPSRPETGYGYVKLGSSIQKGFFLADQFFEKPNFQKASEYISSPDFFWNAGIFCFTSSRFWLEIKDHAEQLYSSELETFQDYKIRFSSFPNLSIDCALMEKSRNLAICPMDINWIDVGSWDTVYEVMKKDRNRNVKIGNVIDIETKNSLIVGGKKLISTIGLDNIIIVETETGIFIAKKGESQKIKRLIEELNKKPSQAL